MVEQTPLQSYTKFSYEQLSAIAPSRRTLPAMPPTRSTYPHKKGSSGNCVKILFLVTTDTEFTM